MAMISMTTSNSISVNPTRRPCEVIRRIIHLSLRDKNVTQSVFTGEEPDTCCRNSIGRVEHAAGPGKAARSLRSVEPSYPIFRLCEHDLLWDATEKPHGRRESSCQHEQPRRHRRPSLARQPFYFPDTAG